MAPAPRVDPPREPGLLALLLVRARAQRVEPITRRLVDSIARENAAYDTSGVVPDEDLWRSCYDNVERLLDMLVLAVLPDGGLASVEDMEPLFDAARATGQRRAEQGLPLDDVLRSYRIGGRLIWEDLVERADPPLDPTSFRDLGVWLWASVDRSSAEVAGSYRRTEQRLLRADTQRVAALWEGLLGGRAREQSFAQAASRGLDLPADAPLILLLLHRTTPEDAAAVVDAVATSYDATTAWQARADGDVIALLALPQDADHRPLVTALGGLRGLDGGVSGRCHGLAETDRAFEQARMAAEGIAPGSGIHAYDRRLVPALLLSSPEIARRLVDQWLGPLRSLPEVEADELVDTLQAWVDAGGSATHAAATIPCHRNTVLNRLGRFTQLTGHRLTDAPPPVGLALALTARDIGLG
ncbi:MAG TPA: helix-turn-helix domain-containing protein [Candidatus Janibacter merdipullorum]|nr:helix-turn-helix domain-containing protein [Candidatus Janibacter merdipullorum]